MEWSSVRAVGRLAESFLAALNVLVDAIQVLATPLHALCVSLAQLNFSMSAPILTIEQLHAALAPNPSALYRKNVAVIISIIRSLRL